MHFRFLGGVAAGSFTSGSRNEGLGAALDRNAYLALEKPSEQAPVRYLWQVEDGLFDAILNLSADPRADVPRER